MDRHEQHTPPTAGERWPWYVRPLAVLPPLCFLALLLIGLRSADLDQETVPVYDSGSEPSAYAESHSSGRNPYTGTDAAFSWDVSRRAQTTFRPRAGGDTSTLLTGLLETSLPPGCEGKTLTWRLLADGQTIDRGTNHYSRRILHTTKHRFSRTPRSITLTASWNGGGAPCTSFRLSWWNVTLYKDVPMFWQPAFYGFGD